MAIEKLQPSYKFNEEQLKQLRQIAPEAFMDNILDFNTLYEVLSDSLEEDDFHIEYFGLMWPGKTDARKIAAIPSRGTLFPQFGEGVGETETNNILIEGENLEVLKILRKSYANRVKLIYIDPPYNTGEDFIYDDDFTESLEEYLRRTNQIDEQGRPLTTNTKSDGRFHSKWLSFMYPRLRLAKDFLTDDGLIFMSIDDNEVHNLIALMNEIFGEENKEGLISWRRRHNQPNDKTKVIGKVAEYILVYSKNTEYLKSTGTFYGVPLTPKRQSDYTNPDKDPKGAWATNPWKAAQGRGGSKYKITTPTGKVHDETWYGNEGTFKDLLDQKRVVFTDSGNGFPRIKIYLSEALESGQSAINFFTHDLYGSNQEGTAEVNALFDNILVFNNPKPTKLLNALINIGTSKGDIILDFFAGSGSIGHASFLTQALKLESRKFILVQIPEEVNIKDDAGKNCKKLGLNKITDLLKERLKRASMKVKAETTSAEIDLGFRVYKLWYSNFKKWQNYNGTDTKQLETLFSQHESSLVDDWKPENLLTEILLIEGFPLDSKIDAVEAFKKNKVQQVTSDFCEHALFVCLDKKVEDETIKALSLGDNDIFICLDNAVTDQDKARLDDKGLIKTI